MTPNFCLFLHSLDLLDLREVSLAHSCLRIVEELLFPLGVGCGFIQHLLS